MYSKPAGSVTEARENRAASVSTPQLTSPRRQQRHPSLQLTKRTGGSTRSLPAIATTTRVNIASDGSALSPPEEPQTDSDSPGKAIDKEETQENNVAHLESPENTKADAVAEPTDPKTPTTGANQPSGWLSWVYTSFAGDKATPNDSPAKSTSEQTYEIQTPKLKQPQGQNDASAASDPSPEHQNKPPEVPEVQPTSQKRSWLQMWYGSSSSNGPERPKDEAVTETEEQASGAVAPSDSRESEPERADSGTATPNSTSTKPSAWSFFFRDSTQERPPDAEAAEASISQDSSVEQSAGISESGPKRNIENKKVKTTPSGPPNPDNTVSKSAASPEATHLTAPEASKQLHKIIPNQVLPRFQDTFALQDRPTLFQSIGRFLHYNKEPVHQHVYKVASPPRIKRALAIGIHGYFPAPFIRSVLGQPTGTSVRFSNKAAEAIRKYTEDKGYGCEIEKIALEGEGRIADRVDLLWKLLLNWMEQIRRADFILIACHSQGVPVGLMLVAKLISFGCINANRVGICAMAGVNLGPFADYRSRWISGSAGELFEFALPYSKVSRDYESALRACIEFGVRISYVGSIDDQLVSLEVLHLIFIFSVRCPATNLASHHCSLLCPIHTSTVQFSSTAGFTPQACMFAYKIIRGGLLTSPFSVSHLVGFALKLRNLGISDHGLIRELSTPLAGSLYTGDGHSRIYEEESIYR